MPRTLTSKACGNCKRRRKKCDQNWPICAPCQRSNLVCPGPSSLVKFINHGGDDGSASSDSSSSKTQKQKQLQPQATDPSTAVMVKRKAWASLGKDGASQAVFRLQTPRTVATTVAERVSRRLVVLLNDGHDAVTRMKMSYLPHTPQRIAHSACLRDCTAFFCSAWADYRRRKPAEMLLAPALCVKATKSLQQALNSDKVYTAETLVAMNMLERAVSLFGVGKAPDLEPHIRGIRFVLMQNRPPDFQDPFDLGAAFESVCVMRAANLVNGLGDHDGLDTPWKEVMDRAEHEHLEKAQSKYLNEAYRELHVVVGRFSTWFQSIRTIQADPKENLQLARQMIQNVSEGEKTMATVIIPMVEKFASNGSITKIPDPESRFGHKYEFTSPGLAQEFIEIHSCHLITLRILWDISEWIGEPIEGIYKKYRAAALKLWMVVPYILSTAPLESISLFEKLVLSIEAADHEEMDYLLDQFLIADSYQKRYPREKEALKYMLSMGAKQVTGRI